MSLSHDIMAIKMGCNISVDNMDIDMLTSYFKTRTLKIGHNGGSRTLETIILDEDVNFVMDGVTYYKGKPITVKFY